MKVIFSLKINGAFSGGCVLKISVKFVCSIRPKETNQFRLPDEAEPFSVSLFKRKMNFYPAFSDAYIKR